MVCSLKFLQATFYVGVKTKRPNRNSVCILKTAVKVSGAGLILRTKNPRYAPPCTFYLSSPSFSPVPHFLTSRLLSIHLSKLKLLKIIWIKVKMLPPSQRIALIVVVKFLTDTIYRQSILSFD